jgi:hypothetical protein
MAKAYRTTLSEALCMLTGMTPIIVKLQDVVQRYNIKEKSSNRTFELDYDVEPKNWPHPADAVTIKDVLGNEDASVHAFTDGSKHDQGVGSGAVIIKGREMLTKLKLKLDNRCSNNQAEQLAILKSLVATESLNTNSINPRTVTIFTDSRVSVDNHAFFVEEIRKKVASLENNVLVGQGPRRNIWQ